jgi:acyl-coenzyme A thioesterase 13
MASDSVPDPTTVQDSSIVIPEGSDPEAFRHITNYIGLRVSPIYTLIFNPGVRLTHASKGLIIARLPITSAHLNSSGSIHGGVSATIVDWAGGLAIASWDLRNATGVSVDINVSYLSGARLGDEIEIEGKAEKVGGSLAFTEVGIWKVKDGARGDCIALGRHTKFVRAKK